MKRSTKYEVLVSCYKYPESKTPKLVTRWAGHFSDKEIAVEQALKKEKELNIGNIGRKKLIYAEGYVTRDYWEEAETLNYSPVRVDQEVKKRLNTWLETMCKVSMMFLYADDTYIRIIINKGKNSLNKEKSKMINFEEQRKKISDIQFRNIRQLRCIADEINIMLENAVDDKAKPEVIKVLSGLLTQTEFALQTLWEIPLNRKWHSYWLKNERCTCPRLDNLEEMGVGDSIYDMTCPIHGLINAVPNKEPEKPLKRKKNVKTGQLRVAAVKSRKSLKTRIMKPPRND